MFLGDAEREYWSLLRGNQEKHRGNKRFQARSVPILFPLLCSFVWISNRLGNPHVMFFLLFNSPVKNFSLCFLGEESTTEVENMPGVEKMILPEVVQIKLKELEPHESDLRT